MKNNNAGFVKHVAVLGLALITMGASASAATVTYSTELSKFLSGGGIISAGGLTLASNGGAAATLTFNPEESTVGSPTNINYGIFSLLCASCTTQANMGGAFFSAFTFELIVTGEGGTGRFLGSSTGGTVFRDVSAININFVPLTLGPGADNATTGSFGTTKFTIAGFTPIVAPNSGNDPGETTVEGSVVNSEVPEPGTMALFGAGLIGMSIFLRKR